MSFLQVLKLCPYKTQQIMVYYSLSFQLFTTTNLEPFSSTYPIDPLMTPAPYCK